MKLKSSPVVLALAIGILFTVIPYYAWQRSYTHDVSLQGTPQQTGQPVLPTPLTLEPSFVAPMADGSLAEVSYNDDGLSLLPDSFASYGGLLIDQCLPEEGLGASLMCDGTLMYTNYCFEQSQKSASQRRQSHPLTLTPLPSPSPVQQTSTNALPNTSITTTIPQP